MEIIKIEYTSDYRAGRSTLQLRDVEFIRLGSAVICASTDDNSAHIELIMHTHAGWLVEPSDEDKRLLIEIL